jgi:glycosyltransferase involved in cell wall biosynthesis
MKIALVRGPSLTRWELQSFEALGPADQLDAFITSGSSVPKDLPPQVGVRSLFWPGQWAGSIHPRAAWLFNGLSSRLLGVSYRMSGLEKALRGYDIIHSLETHNTFSLQAARAKVNHRSRLVVTVWETIAGRGESHPYRTAGKRFVTRHADAFLAVTERTRRMLLAEGVDDARIRVIPMGIDLSHFVPRKPDPERWREWGKQEGELVVLCIARLVEEKGTFDLLKAVCRLKVERPELKIRLVLAGSGPKKQEWQAWVARARLSNAVVFAGQYPYEAIPSLMASADAFALASVPTPAWEEQFGYVLVEAMASGLPIVTTESGAIPEVVGDAARLAPPRNSTALAAALAEVLTDKALRSRLRDKGIIRASQRYDGRVVCRKILDLYQSLLKG